MTRHWLGCARKLWSGRRGTPLFLEEIARSLAERGVMETSRPRLRAGIASIGIPASIQAVLAERLDRLPADRRRLLQLASVIGKDIPLDLLRRMTDLPEDRLAEELAELQARRSSAAAFAVRSGGSMQYRNSMVVK